MSIFKRKRDDDSPSEPSRAEPAPAEETEPLGEEGTGGPLLPIVAGYSWRILVVLAMGWVAVWVLVQLRLVVVPVIAALFLSVFLGPLAQWLKAKGWPAVPAAAAVMLGGTGILVGIAFLIAPSVGSELDEVSANVQEGFQRVLDYLARSPLQLSQQDIDNYMEQAVDQLAANRKQITSGVLSGAVKLAEFVTQFFLTIVLTFFFVKDGFAMFHWFQRQFPDRNRRHVRAVGERAWMALGGYLRGVSITGVVNALLLAIVLVVIGVPLVIPLAILTFFGAFFPVVGAIAAGTIATLVALVTTGLADALVVAGATLVIQQVEGNVLQPVVMGKAVKLHPVVILLTLTAGGVIAGVIGAFLAVPVAAVAASVGNYVKQVQAGTV